jgi:hypothetical protein
MDESPAERVARVAIDLCAHNTDDDLARSLEASERLASEASGRRTVVLDAFVLCVMLSATGEVAADRAAHLLDDVQSTNLVR